MSIDMARLKRLFGGDGRHKVNIWKVVSVVFLFLFIIVLVGGLFRASHSRGSLTPPTQAQVGLATAAVAKALQEKGDDIGSYRVVISRDVRRFGRPETPLSIIQVSLERNSTRQMFLVDAGTGELLMWSQTEFYGGMGSLFPAPPMERLEASGDFRG